MSEPKVTAWIPGTVKPTLRGIYQRRFLITTRGVNRYARWTGKYWKLSRSTIEDAAKERYRSPLQNNREWRGLSCDPKSALEYTVNYGTRAGNWKAS